MPQDSSDAFCGMPLNGRVSQISPCTTGRDEVSTPKLLAYRLQRFRGGNGLRTPSRPSRKPFLGLSDPGFIHRRKRFVLHLNQQSLSQPLTFCRRKPSHLFSRANARVVIDILRGETTLDKVSHLSATPRTAPNPSERSPAITLGIIDSRTQPRLTACTEQDLTPSSSALEMHHRGHIDNVGQSYSRPVGRSRSVSSSYTCRRWPTAIRRMTRAF